MNRTLRCTEETCYQRARTHQQGSIITNRSIRYSESLAHIALLKMRDVEQRFSAPRPNADSVHHPNAPELGRRLGVTVSTTPTCRSFSKFWSSQPPGIVYSPEC
jgi:hypothetical protein